MDTYLGLSEFVIADAADALTCSAFCTDAGLFQTESKAVLVEAAFTNEVVE